MTKSFNKICRMSQKELKNYVTMRLKETHREVTVADGFVYAQGSFPVLLVAHMDTVHKELVKQIVCNGDVISSPQGIGGDDRCGVYMILQIIQKYNCSVLFCEDEEVGCIGANKFVRTELASELKDKFNYIIEFDRKGHNDAVFYDCGNDEFEDFITKEFFKTDWGSFSDISVIAPELGCAAVNLSCGYYKAHTTDEYIVWSEMQASMDNAMKILARTTEKDKFEYIEVEDDGYGRYWLYGDYGKSIFEPTYEDSYYHIEYIDNDSNYKYYGTMALSEAEAIGIFLMDNEDLRYANVVEVWRDDYFV